MVTNLKHVFFADFETDNLSDMGMVKAYAWTHSHKLIKEEERSYDDSLYYSKNPEYFNNPINYYDDNNKNVIYHFLKTVFDNSIPKSKKYFKTENYWYFHNFAGFDSSFIIEPLLQLGFKQVKHINNLEDKIFSIININSKIIHLEIKYQNKTIMFRDTFLLFPMKLSSLGAFLNKPKLETDYDIDLSIKDEKYNQYVQYTKRDIEILRDYFVYMTKEIGYDYTSTFTTATLAKKYIKKYYKDIKQDKKYKEITIWNHRNRISDWLWTNNSYKGGFTNINEKYRRKVVENVSYYDLNSSYPAIMTGLLPSTTPLSFIPDNCEYATMYEIKINKLKIKENQIPILWKNGAKNEFVSEINIPTNYTLWDEQLDFLPKVYDFEYEVISQRYFVLQPIFKDIIPSLYNARMEFKKQMKQQTQEDMIKYYDALQQNMKIIMNSSYGFHAEKPLKENKIYLLGNPNEYIINEDGIDYIFIKNKFVKGMKINEYKSHLHIPKLNEIKDRKFYQRYRVTSHHLTLEGYTVISIIMNEEEVTQTRNIAISSYITMKGRMKIWNQIQHIGADNVIYWDTDSIITINDKKPSNISDKLGDWKLEGNFNYFLGFKAKQYILSNTKTLNEKSKYTIAGVNEFNNLHGQDIYNVSIQDDITLIKNQSKSTLTGKIINRKEIHI